MSRRLAGALVCLAATAAAAAAAPLTPDDPLFPQLWGLQNPVEGVDIRAPLAWGITTGSPDVLVAVIDTGIDRRHPDLAPNLRPDLSRNFVPGLAGTVDPAAWDDRDGHGTHIAATLAARGDDGVGIPGVVWNAGLVALRACADRDGDGRIECAEQHVVAALDAAGAMGARVANVSLAGDAGPAVRAAIQAHPGTLYVVAAGNGGIDVDASSSAVDALCRFPAANLICVGAIDRSGAPWASSNVGRTSVDLFAPGVDIRSAALRFQAVSLGDVADPAAWGRTTDADWSPAPPPAAGIDTQGSPAEALLTRAAPISLAGGRACRLQHEVRVLAELGERRLAVQYRIGGGPWTDAAMQEHPAAGAPAARRLVDLSPADGADGVGVRYRFTGEGSAAAGPGVRLDGPVVTCLADSAPAGAFASAAGTSAAVPHVAGTLALLAARDPAATPAALRARLLATVRVLPALAPLSVTGGIPDAARALGHVDPPAEPPPPPAPVAPADPPPVAPQPVIVPAAPVALVVPGRLRADARGRVAVRVRCRATAPARCVGAVRVQVRMRGLRVLPAGARGPGVRTVLVGRAPLRIGAGRVAVVRLPLTARARVLLGGRAGVPVRVALSAGRRPSARVSPLLLGALVSPRR